MSDNSRKVPPPSSEAAGSGNSDDPVPDGSQEPTASQPTSQEDSPSSQNKSDRIWKLLYKSLRVSTSHTATSTNYLSHSPNYWYLIDFITFFYKPRNKSTRRCSFHYYSPTREVEDLGTIQLVDSQCKKHHWRCTWWWLRWWCHSCW